MNPYLYPAKIVKYNAKDRTTNVTIEGLTDGLDEGIVALLAYPIGDDDTDTERELLAGADVWVFFEKGDQHCPVVAFYRSHGEGRAVVDYRRIRQENIELLARATITLEAKDLVDIKAKTIHLKANKINIDGDIEHKGDTQQTGNLNQSGSQSVNGNITASNVTGGGVSLKTHIHGGVKSGTGTTSPPR